MNHALLTHAPQSDVAISRSLKQCTDTGGLLNPCCPQQLSSEENPCNACTNEAEALS